MEVDPARASEGSAVKLAMFLDELVARFVSGNLTLPSYPFNFPKLFEWVEIFGVSHPYLTVRTELERGNPPPQQEVEVREGGDSTREAIVLEEEDNEPPLHASWQDAYRSLHQKYNSLQVRNCLSRTWRSFFVFEGHCFRPPLLKRREGIDGKFLIIFFRKLATSNNYCSPPCWRNRVCNAK